jgi:hypothetical protein
MLKKKHMSLMDFCHVGAHTLHTWHTITSRDSVWKQPHTKFLDPLMGFMLTYYTTPFLHVSSLFFPFLSLSPCPQVSVQSLSYMIDSHMFTPKLTCGPLSAQALWSQLTYNSKCDNPLHPCVLDSFTMSHLYSHL